MKTRTIQLSTYQYQILMVLITTKINHLEEDLHIDELNNQSDSKIATDKRYMVTVYKGLLSAIESATII